MRLRPFAITILLFIFNNMSAQEMLFHVNTASPLSFNPAFAGNGNNKHGAEGRLFMNTSQNDIQKINAQLISMDWKSWNLGSGLGFIYEEQSVGHGLIKLRALKGIYNYFLPINRKLTIRAAIQPGIEIKTLDVTRILYFQSPDEIGIHPSYYDSYFTHSSNKVSRTYFTLGSGILIQTRNMEAGIAFQNINRPNWAFSENTVVKKSMQSNFHIQYMFFNHKKYELYAKSLLSTQLSTKLFNIGTQIKSKHWMGGISINNYRSSYSKGNYVLGTFGFTIHQFQLRYGYEFNLTKTPHPNFNNQSLTLQLQFMVKRFNICHRPFIPNYRFNDITF